MHQIQIDIVRTELLQRLIKRFGSSLVIWIVQFGCQPEVFASYSRSFDPSSDFGFIAVGRLYSDQSWDFDAEWRLGFNEPTLLGSLTAVSICL